QAGEAAPSSHPDGARLVLEDRVHPVVGERVGGSIPYDPGSLHPGDAVGGAADPDVAAPVLVYGSDRVPERRRLFVADAPSLTEPSDSPAAGTDPAAAGAGPEHLADVSRRPIGLLREWLEQTKPSPLEPRHASGRGPDPESRLPAGAK